MNHRHLILSVPLALVFLLVFPLTGCPSGQPGVNPGSGPTDGTEGGACLDGDVCSNGLACVGGVCAAMTGEGEGEGEGDAGSDAGPADAGFDAGPLDAGFDGGPVDAGQDAGPLDAGFDGGPRDAGFDAGPPVPCDNTSECASGKRCLLVGTDGGLSGFCGPRVGSGIPGTGCSDGSECNTGLCLENFCSALCTSRDDCGPDQACRTRDVTVGTVTAQATVCVTLPETSCATTSDCEVERVCGRLDFDGSAPLDTYCTFPVLGGLDVGDTCSTTGNSTECTDRVCLASLNSSCSRVCGGDSDCQTDGGPGGYLCSDVDFNANGSVRLCLEGCSLQSDCTGDEVCHLSSDTADDGWEWVCRQPGASRTQAPGEDCFVDAGSGPAFACSTGYCFAGKCTTPCEGDNNCPNTLPTCGDTNTTRPGGDGGFTLRVCRP